MIPFCERPELDEDQIADQQFGSLTEIRTAFFGDGSVPDERHEEILAACRDIAHKQVVVSGFRRPRANRVAARKELATKFGLSGVLLIYYVVCVIWFWRQLRRGG